ncbi:NUDIX hydrolase [Streptomyces sp. IBSBF 2435]|uniref:NUDIX hydrolase n=1 Tax=Streptomyces sp. IBSBF 2435 TaxID=2903531 RepID=UPI002FDC0D73
MATPQFIVDIRARAGAILLFLPGVVTVVFDETGRVLLNRRTDTGRWALISGIPDPGEQPAEAAVREIHEETGIRAVPERILGVFTNEPVIYGNGDRSQYIDIVLQCRAVGGEARVNDEESLEVRWYAPGALPPLSENDGMWIERALREDPAWFAPAAPPASWVGSLETGA